MSLPKVETGVPMPTGHFLQVGDLWRIRNLLEIMEPAVGKDTDQHFVWPDNGSPYKAAAQLGIEIKTRKLDGGGYRVWRVK
jgi:hypothetical protein